MKNILVLIGACCHNRGSEALVRGTVSILKQFIQDSRIILSGAEEAFGSGLNYPFVDEYVRRYSFYGGRSIKRCLFILFTRIIPVKYISERIQYTGLIKACRKADLIIVIGGDNYDKAYASFAFMHEANRILRKTSKAKMVMYDCSLAPEEIDEEIIKDMSMFDAITAREPITYDAFARHFPKEKLFYFPDPAFVMESKKVDLPEGYVEGKTVGVNLSTLIMGKQYGNNAELIMQAYVNLVKHILKNTDLHVLLIPHVMRGKDLSALKMLHEHFKESKRVALLSNEGLNAVELKYIISKLRFFIGARTHSTIAAYSSCVPTLVLGYSVKSKGIAKDLFGSEAGYVVNLTDLKTSNDLDKAFENIYNNEQKIRAHLNNIIPAYIQKSWDVGELLIKLLEEKDKND